MLGNDIPFIMQIFVVEANRWLYASKCLFAFLHLTDTNTNNQIKCLGWLLLTNNLVIQPLTDIIGENNICSKADRNEQTALSYLLIQTAFSKAMGHVKG